MTTHAVSTALPGATVRPAAATAPIALEKDIVTSVAARRALAVLRYATGFIFLWAFLDKTFGLGFSTPVERAWPRNVGVSITTSLSMSGTMRHRSSPSGWIASSHTVCQMPVVRV